MKKQLLNLSMVAGALALYIGTVFAAPTAPYERMEVPYATIEVDGDADDGYSAETATVFMYDSQQAAYGGASDFTCVFRIAWDVDYLYLWADITDETPHLFTGAGNDYEFDNVEWFVQFDTNTVTVTPYDAGTHQFRLNRGLDTVRNSGNVLAETWGGVFMETDNGTGWVCEVAMPWEAVWGGDPAGVLPEDIMVYVEEGMGFDFAGADSDGTDPAAGARDYQTCWDDDNPGTGDADLAWNNTSMFGFITFEIPDAVNTNTVKTVKVHPVPATSTINFELTSLQTVVIYNMAGTKVMEVVTDGHNVDITGLAEGMYVAKTLDGITRFVKK